MSDAPKPFVLEMEAEADPAATATVTVFSKLPSVRRSVPARRSTVPVVTWLPVSAMFTSRCTFSMTLAASATRIEGA